MVLFSMNVSVVFRVAVLEIVETPGAGNPVPVRVWIFWNFR